MKFIKNFNEKNNNKLYYQINLEEFNKYLDFGNKEVINDNFLKSIKDIIDNKNIKMSYSVQDYIDNPLEKNCVLFIKNDKSYDDYDDLVYIQVFCDNDYWIWVYIELYDGDFYYKCDDLEGFSNMIDDNQDLINT